MLTPSAVNFLRVLTVLLASVALSSHAAAQPVIIARARTIGPTDTTIQSTSGGPHVPLATAQITVEGDGTELTISGRHTIASLLLRTRARLRHPPRATYTYSGEVVNGLHLIVTGNVTIQTATAIYADGMGYSGGMGPGGGQTGGPGHQGSGGGHGGTGARGSSYELLGGQANDSTFEPRLFGSGGGGTPGVDSGSGGGGALRLNVGGALLVDGSISARGAGTMSSGAGGSIWITAGSISGAGSITARGGDAFNEIGGGGGGRIALYAQSCTLTNVSAEGDGSGGPGTVYLAIGSDIPTVAFISGSISGSYRYMTPLTLPLDFPDANIRIGPGSLYTTSRITTNHNRSL